MAQTIKLKRSATQGAVPSTSALALGEIAINTYDGNLFIKKNDGSESIVTIGGLADNAVTSAKIAANAVKASEIATNAVGISEFNVSDGTSGQVLTTDGAGSLSFTSKVSTAQSFYLNSATGDGSTTDFSLSTTPAAESNIIAFIDGVFQTQDSYTFSGTTLSFSSAPPNGTEVTVYVVGAIFSGNSVVLDTFSGDDSTTQFTLSENPENENNTQVYIDGVYQQKSEYSVSSQTLTFSSAPPTGTNNIEVVAFSVTNLTVLNANSVSSASIAANAVTSTHIATNQVGISELNLSDGTNGQVITTDGSGTLSFSTISVYTDSDVETYLDGGTSTPTFATATVSGTANFGSLSDGTITITAFADEDNMVSNSATLVPTQQSVKAYVDAEVAGIVDSAPGTLDTLNELAAALGDDANFSTTVTNSIAAKLPLAGGTMTGNLVVNTASNSLPSVSLSHSNASADNFILTGGVPGTSNAGFSIRDVDAAVNRLVIDTSGNVGIGTNSPTDKLNISSGTNQIGLDTGNQATYGTLDIGHFTNGAFIGTQAGSNAASNILRFGTSGTERVRVDSSGNTSIGTTGTNRKLTVSGSSTSQGTIYAYTNQVHTGTDTNAHVSIRSDNASASGDVLHVRGDGSGNLLTIDKSGTEKLIVDSSGNVGIGLTPLYSGNGTARPSLEIGGSTEGNLAFNGSGKDGLIITNSKNIGGVFKAAHTGLASAYGQTAGEHIWYTAASVSAGSNQTFDERMRIDSAGSVGIGTSSPSGQLNVHSSTAGSILKISDSTTGNTATDGLDLLVSGTTGYLWNREAGNLLFGTSNAERMRINSAGNVGIGTINPTAKLHVATAGAEGINIGLQNNERYWNMETDGGLLMWKDISAGGLIRMAIDTSGNVGIGQASDGDKLHVLGTGFFEDSRGNGVGVQINGGSSSEFAHIGVSASNPLTFQTADTERMRIYSNGEVGINTTSGGAKLNVKATGSDTSNWCQRYFTTGTGSTLYVVDFIDYQGQRVGYITNNPVANTTAYVTSSDYRLKENVDYTWDATTRLKQLKPARFNWIRDESNTLVDGFLAHEVEDIVPEAITGEKDATETKTNAVVNSYGNYIDENVTEEEWLAGKEDGTYDADTTWAASHTQNFYQGIDQAKLVPLLVKTIQELEARITTLENA